MQNSFIRIYSIVRQIPPGRVSSYGTIAALAGNPRWIHPQTFVGEGGFAVSGSNRITY